MNYVRFFLGTPVRAMWTLGMALGTFLVLMTIHLLAPGAIANTIAGTIRELTPLFNALIVLVITIFGFRLMFRGFAENNRGRRH